MLKFLSGFCSFESLLNVSHELRVVFLDPVDCKRMRLN